MLNGFGFRHVVQESNTGDYATVTDQGHTVGLCVDSNGDTDLLLTPDQARQLARALDCAAFLVEHQGML